MYVLYQAGGPLLGIGESVDEALAAAEAALDERAVPLLDALGGVLTAEDATDLTRSSAPPGGLEVPDNLYVRRGTYALWVAAWQAGAREEVAYQVGQDGVVRLAPAPQGGAE